MNSDGCSTHYNTPASVSAVLRVIYQHELRPAVSLWYIRLLYL